MQKQTTSGAVVRGNGSGLPNYQPMLSAEFTQEHRILDEGLVRKKWQTMAK
jgi:hypothetical protein